MYKPKDLYCFGIIEFESGITTGEYLVYDGALTVWCLGLPEEVGLPIIIVFLLLLFEGFETHNISDVNIGKFFKTVCFSHSLSVYMCVALVVIRGDNLTIPNILWVTSIYYMVLFLKSVYC